MGLWIAIFGIQKSGVEIGLDSRQFAKPSQCFSRISWRANMDNGITRTVGNRYLKKDSHG